MTNRQSARFTRNVIGRIVQVFASGSTKRKFQMTFFCRAFAFTILTVLVTSLVPDGTLAAPAQQAPCPTVGDTMSLLQSQDPGYAEALEFGRFLQKHHINLRCITRTTFNYLLGEQKAAGFQTDVGTISVVFFPAPDGAERITIGLTVSHGLYRYTFRTKQAGLAGHQVMVVDSPLHFMIQGGWFILLVDSRAEQPLRLALLEPPCPHTDATGAQLPCDHP